MTHTKSRCISFVNLKEYLSLVILNIWSSSHHFISFTSAALAATVWEKCKKEKLTVCLFQSITSSYSKTSSISIILSLEIKQWK